MKQFKRSFLLSFALFFCAFNIGAHADMGVEKVPPPQQPHIIQIPHEDTITITFPELMKLVNRMAKSQQPVECGPGKKCVPIYRLEGLISVFEANDLIHFLETAKKQNADAVVIEINTPGGSVNDGFSIIQAIENFGKPVYCVAEHQAMSEGFAILQACPFRYMTKRARLMTHEPSVANLPTTMGIQELQEHLDDLKSVALIHATHCVKRLKISLDEYNEKVKGVEWYLDPQEALDVGAVDSIVEDSASVLKRLRK